METPDQRLERRLDEYVAHYRDPAKAKIVFREYLLDISKVDGGLNKALSLVQECDNSEDLDIRLDVFTSEHRPWIPEELPPLEE